MSHEKIEKLRAQFKDVLAALRANAQEIATIPGLAAARPGYTLGKDDKQEPTLVLAFKVGAPAFDTAAFGKNLGVAVRLTGASPEEQLRGAVRPSFDSPLQALLDPIHPPDFAPPKRGTYQPPKGAHAPRLDPIDEKMKVTLCASPDCGWPVLRDFFRTGIDKRLTVAMYDFTARHIEQALTNALKASPDATFRLVLDGQKASGGVGGNGINGQDSLEADVMKRLRKAFGDRFELVRASVGAHGAVPRAYHIKVAVADGNRVWLSSGNWQSSNQAPFDYQVKNDKPPFPLGRYNRDYHVVAHSKSLARIYAAFIEYDATLGGDYAGPELLEDEPMLLVPEEGATPEDFAPKERFEPLELDEQVKVTPLLTPDNFPRVVNDLLAKAKQRVWIQNQYLQPTAEGDNFPELDELLERLGTLAEKVDLRLCLRSLEEGHRDRILAAGVKPSQIRIQNNCHAKLIVIDDHIVVVGSQNLSNLGFVANRDASLAFENAKVNDYFASIFEEDWEHARVIADGGDSLGVRLATDDTTPAGFRRVPWSAVFDTPAPVTPAAVPIPKAATDKVAVVPPPSVDLLIPFFGIDPDGKRDAAKLSDIATALRKGAGAVDTSKEKLGKMMSTESFGIPPGAASENLEDVGWGVVWAPNTPQAIKDALKPLLDHRRTEVNDDDLFHELDYKAGETLEAFLARHGGELGSIKPGSVPYYLLLVGSPDAIPFTFQSVLDVEYRVGRLDLPDAAAYARYAQSVVAAETGKTAARARELHAFGAEHDGDAPTALSCDVLVRAAPGWLEAFPKLRTKFGLNAKIHAADDATKAKLLEILRGGAGRPELLFTAGHGLLVASGKPAQASQQGALVTADWDGLSGINADCLFAASDVPADADLGGMVAFLFACFGVGTPATDSFPTRFGQPLAPKPFVSALPNALLSHPKGGVLGVFGHVDRALTWSLQPPNAGVATDPFARAAINVLAGNRLGAALDDLNQRGATLGASVATAMKPNAPPINDIELVKTWTQQRDATAFILLGDPAARLKR